MNGIGVNLEGQQAELPGVYHTVNTSRFNRPRPFGAKRLAIIAPALGGPPRKFTAITPSEAARVLKGGVGLELVNDAADPSPLGGASDILFYRVNAATKGSLNLGNLTVTAKDAHAGVEGNAIRVRRDSVPGDAAARRLSVELPGDGLGAEESPELGPALEISYVGSGAAPTVTVQDSAGQKALALASDVAVEARTILIGGSGVKTFSELAQLINETGAWTAKVLYRHGNFNPGGLAAGAVAVSANKATLDLGVEAQAQWLAGSRYVSAAVAGGAEAGLDAGWLYLSGGTEGPAVTANDYANALNALEDEDVQAVLVGTPDPAVAAMGAAHCRSMSHPVNRRERVFFTGEALAASAEAQESEAIELAASLDTDAAVVAGTAVLRRNPRTGLVEELPPFRVAAMLAGLWCALGWDQPLTYKPLKVLGVVHKSERALKRYLTKGVTGVMYDADDQTYRVSEAITTWQADLDPQRRKLHGVGVRFFLNKYMRFSLKKWAGGVASQDDLRQMLADADAALLRQVRGSGGTNNPNGVLTAGQHPETGEDVPPYSDLRLVFDGNSVVALTYRACAIGEITQIVGEATFEPIKITA
ncbi:hypothetical protein [Calidithermus chliarophilus]|uniref:hypothetical protein n=1 Tax=Calidithermus chliarophilus TaxID=52023 RepID=UPI000400F5C8|nr:hypothetical protein [Calidithermus chliarophilus]